MIDPTADYLEIRDALAAGALVAVEVRRASDTRMCLWPQDARGLASYVESMAPEPGYESLLPLLRLVEPLREAAAYCERDGAPLQ